MIDLAVEYLILNKSEAFIGGRVRSSAGEVLNLSKCKKALLDKLDEPSSDSVGDFFVFLSFDGLNPLLLDGFGV